LTTSYTSKQKAKPKRNTEQLLVRLSFGQVLGELAIDNPELPVDFVVQVLASMKEPRSDATPFQPRSRT
jgi:hypothetical protein